MDLENDIFKINNIKIEIVENLNNEDINNKSKFKQKQKIKNQIQKPINSNYIINGISINRKKFIKRNKDKKIF